MRIGAVAEAVLLLTLLQRSQAQEELPAWLFRATLVDTLHLPPGTQGSDLLADETFREFVRNLFSGAMVLPMIHIPPSAFVLENATVLEDVYSEAINAHGGVGQGKKSVRFEAVMTVASRQALPSEINRYCRFPPDVKQNQQMDMINKYKQSDIMCTVNKSNMKTKTDKTPHFTSFKLKTFC